ncbi:MAG TPA: alpha/beta fold hydrolase [Gemmataceae bacterium]|nr:alpha/beta fold hydrolase [Gemmataceae bacterium]
MRLRLVLFALLFVGSAAAQPDRYELGRRMHLFEVAWDEKAADPAAKKRAAPHVNRAVQSYFTLNLPGVAQALDEARYALQGGDVPAAVKWADSLAAVPETRVVDVTTGELSVTVKAFYKSDAAAPAGAVARAAFGRLGARVEAKLDTLPVTLKLPAPPGDQSEDTRVTVEILVDGKPVSAKSAGVSRVAKFAERLAAVKANPLPGPPTTIEQATFADLVKLLTEFEKKGSPETDYPVSRLMSGAEALIRDKEKGDYYTYRRAGVFWLTVPTAKTPTVIRISIPPTKKDGPKEAFPVLVALHGMGGSENLFFDGYGAGIVPRLAAERKWLVVAPRVTGLLGGGPAPDVPAILDQLAKRYPIDEKRVYVVGHSMGAGHALQLAQANPKRFAAVAALGGGGRVSKPDAFAGVPVYVGCGKLDFALGGARALHKSLDAAKVAVTLKEYDDIEHLTIVREAAPDVIKFFEGVGKK